MLCRVANLYVEVPATGDMESRCKAYLCEDGSTADIVIDAEHYRPELYPEELGEDLTVYLESGWQFYGALLRFGGLMLHASAVELDGKAYLFSGPSGMGTAAPANPPTPACGSRSSVRGLRFLMMTSRHCAERMAAGMLMVHHGVARMALIKIKGCRLQVFAF